MEHAPLRPIPSRPPGPVDVASATAVVRSALPGLDERAGRALALVGLAGRPRGEAAQTLGVDDEELARALAAARKALRAQLRSLPGSGWCERAERLISDRLDLQLADREAAILDVHLRNCPRCVEHERRLVQATDALVAELPQAVAELPALSEVPATDEPEGPALEVASPLPSDDPASEPESAADEPPAAEPASPASTAAEESPAVEPAPPATDTATAFGAQTPTPSRARLVAAAVGWNALIVLAVLLALASIAIAVAGALGAEL